MNRRQILQRLSASFAGIVGMNVSASDETGGANQSSDDKAAERTDASVPRFGVPTMGGVQFWGDLHFLQGWKIQRNVLTGHYRLLDPSNNRFASGTLEQCQSALDMVRRDRKLIPDRGRAVILIHGIGRSSKSFPKLIARLRKEGYVVVPFEYPSTRMPLEQSAECLRSLLSSMTHITSFDFVVHSMGGLVVRTLLKQHGNATELNGHPLHRMVMLGTPNHGAQLADMLKKTTIYGLIYGPAGQQLVTAADGIISQLPVPAFEFAVIAGGKGTDKGYNPLLPGDNDGTVTVASTRLAGAADFLQVPRLHSFLMNDPVVVDATCCFLNSGRLDPDRPPAPITADVSQ